MRAAALRSRMSTAVHGGKDRLWGTSSKLHTPSRLHSAAGVQSAPVTSRLQQLYDVVREKLKAGPITTHEDAQEVSAALSEVPLEELGLDADAVQDTHGISNPLGMWGLRLQSPSRPSRPEAVRYLDIIHSDEDDPLTPTSMTIGVFSLPAGTSIPLHNHPGMTVFSRLLYGKLHIRAYDLLDPRDPAAQALQQSLGPAVRWGAPIQAARLVTDRVLTAPASSANMVLFPTSGGNIHRFEALSACAILDVLTPPYAPGAGRDCTYFREIIPATTAAPQHQHQPPQQEQQQQSQGQPVIVGLQPCPPPANFQVLTDIYQGIKVVP